MEVRLNSKGYLLDIGQENMSAIWAASFFRDRVPPFHLEGGKGVVRAKYSTQPGQGTCISVTFEVDDNGDPIGFDDFIEALKAHIGVCETYLTYVDVNISPDDPKGLRRVLLHVGDGFVLCDAGSAKEKDLGVSLNFLSSNQRSAKWFTNEAADQFRELAAAGDDVAIRRIVGKHIDLDPPVSAPKGP